MSARAPSRIRWDLVWALGRRLAGVIVGGALGALVWLIIMQEGLRHGWTDHDFNDGMGALLGASGDAERTGFRGTLVLGLLLGVVYVLVQPWIARRVWWRGLAFTLVPFVLWGAVFCPLIDSRVAGDPSGLFGSDAGSWTWLVALAASLGYTVVLARVYALMSTAWWWRPREREVAETIEAITEPGSLELSEERPEERRVGP